MIPARVSMITLGVRDFERMRVFYRALGWAEFDPESVGHTVFKTGGGLLSLFPLADLAADAQVDAPSVQQFGGITLAVNVERPEMVDAAAEVARAAGAQITREPQHAFWGGRHAYFRDPEGNTWEIAWAPNAGFDERGAMIWA